MLLVEDHLEMREALVNWLEVLYPDWIIIKVSTAEEAINRCSQDRIDIVLIDLDLKGMNGFQATQFIKSHYPYIKVVLLTMHEEKPFEEEAFIAGVDGYLVKRKIYHSLPVVLESLLENVGMIKDEQMEKSRNRE